MSQVLKYLSINEEDDISWTLIEAALSSVARTTIIPIQDVLGLGNSARMNIPATQVRYCDEIQSSQIGWCAVSMEHVQCSSFSFSSFFFGVGGGRWALNLPNHVDLTIEDYSNLNWRPLCPAWSDYTGSNTFELYIYITRI